MNSIYSPANSFEPIPRRWTTMSVSAVVHAAAFSGVVAVAAATVSVVAPRDESPIRFVQVVAPPPPVRIPVRLPPIPKEAVKFVEAPAAAPIPVPVPEPEIARVDTPAPEPEPAIEPARPKTPAVVTVGAFEPAAARARSVEVARPVQAAGLDAAPARAAEVRQATAAVGLFDQAAATGRPQAGAMRAVGDAGFGGGTVTQRGRAGGGGGVVADSGFGSGAGGTGRGTQPGQGVKTTDFDARAEPRAAAPAPRQVRADTSLEILSKPTPVYTEDARAMKIEGEVLLDVEFTGSGEIRVLKVVRGLGHGLDESAVRAVQAMRFKPAQRDGQPVDIRTTVNIVFRLA